MTNKLPVLFALIILQYLTSTAQVQIFKESKAGTIKPPAQIGFKNSAPVIYPDYNNTNNLSITNYSNQATIEEYKRHQQYLAKKEKLINDAIKAAKAAGIKYTLPSLSKFPGTEHYRSAFEKISELLETKNYDLKKAVFISENAFTKNQLDYGNYSNAIASIKNLCQQILQKSKNKHESLAKNIAAFQYMADTLVFYSNTKEKEILSYPMRYDFTDYEGKKDWTKMFVNKLMTTGDGQCHSLPLFFMILSQELGSEAFLSYSPSHSFIKIRDKNNKWYNLELTNGMIISDAAIIESGFVKAEAIRNKIYLDTISAEKVVASTLVDLALGYRFLYGYDDFVLKCVDKSLEYFPNNIYALQLLADYHTLEFGYIAHQYKRPPLEVLMKDEKAKEAFERRNEIYKKIDQIGYEAMPSDRYEAWLKSLKNENNKKENREKKFTIDKLIKY